MAETVQYHIIITLGKGMEIEGEQCSTYHIACACGNADAWSPPTPRSLLLTSSSLASPLSPLVWGSCSVMLTPLTPRYSETGGKSRKYYDGGKICLVIVWCDVELWMLCLLRWHKIIGSTRRLELDLVCSKRKEEKMRGGVATCKR